MENIEVAVLPENNKSKKMYCCDKCNYRTTNCSNFYIHNKSKQHNSDIAVHVCDEKNESRLESEKIRNEKEKEYRRNWVKKDYHENEEKRQRYINRAKETYKKKHAEKEHCIYCNKDITVMRNHIVGKKHLLNVKKFNNTVNEENKENQEKNITDIEKLNNIENQNIENKNGI